jgi:hypothetical protein
MEEGLIIFYGKMKRKFFLLHSNILENIRMRMKPYKRNSFVKTSSFPFKRIYRAGIIRGWTKNRWKK